MNDTRPAAIPTTRPHDQAILQPDQRQRHRVEGGQQQADEPDAPNEAGQRGVEQPQLLADHGGVGARQPAVDPGNHPVPVAQQVERHDRGYEQECEKVKQRDALAPQTADDAPHPRDHVAGVGAGGLAQALDVLGRKAGVHGLHQGDGPFAEPGHILRDVLQKRDELRLQQRHQQDQGDEPDAEEGGEDEGGGDAARESPALQPVDGGVEEIGDRHPDHERQQDPAEQVKRGQDGRDARRPEERLYRGRHRAPPTSAVPRYQRTR
jgi:hypothetical protein